jgi:hypothetical protein
LHVSHSNAVEASFPPVMNPKIEALVTPNAELFNSAEKSINNFSQAFPLYVNPEYAKTPKKRKIQVLFAALYFFYFLFFSSLLPNFYVYPFFSFFVSLYFLHVSHI